MDGFGGVDSEERVRLRSLHEGPLSWLCDIMTRKLEIVVVKWKRVSNRSGFSGTCVRARLPPFSRKCLSSCLWCGVDLDGQGSAGYPMDTSSLLRDGHVAGKIKMASAKIHALDYLRAELCPVGCGLNPTLSWKALLAH